VRQGVMVLLSALVPFLVANMVVPQQLTLQQLREERKKAAHRQRRIIFNNDGDDVLAYASAPTPDALLKVRTSALVGSQVDAIFYCTTQTFGMSLHNSRATQVQTSREGVYSKNIVPDLIAQGTDALRIMVEFGHNNGMEVFWSMRMNDVHDGSPGHPYRFPQWKKNHPECLFGTPDNRPTGVTDGRAWAGVDYGRMAVREMAFRTIEEVCRNYDIDGIELDFFRHPAFFKRHAWGEPLGRKELDMMTGLMRRVRRMTEEVSIERGRPILVAVRVPDSVGYCEAIGLDVTRWLREDLIDILVASGYFRLSPWKDTIALGHKYGVPVYPSLDESRMPNDSRKVRNSIQCYRARAMNCWNAGADGIYLFNLFNPKAPHWRQLGDPRELEKLDKLYVLGARGIWAANVYLPHGDRFATRPILTPARPATLAVGKPYVITLPVGDNVLWGKSKGIVPKITLSLQTERLASADSLSVTLNGTTLDNGVLAGGWLEYKVSLELVRKGENRLEITLLQGEETVVVRDLQLAIHYQRPV